MRSFVILKKHKNIGLIQKILLVLVILCLVVSCFPARAAEHEKNTLRVGYWAFDGYHNLDQNGVRSGYGYELLQLMSRYSNINFTYHGYEQTFAQSKQMLEDGKIDLLTAMKKSRDNIDRFDFSSHSIGSTSTILTIKAGNSRIVSGHYDTYQGMRIGIVPDDVREEELTVYAKEKGFSYEVKYYESSPVMAQALQDEEIDAIVSTSLRARTNEWTIDSFSESLSWASPFSSLATISSRRSIFCSNVIFPMVTPLFHSRYSPSFISLCARGMTGRFL